MVERKAVWGKQRPNEGCRLRLVSRRLLWLFFACAGRFCSFLSDKKEIKELGLNKEMLTGHRGVYSKTYHQYRVAPMLPRAHTKPPQSCGFATIRLLLMRSSLMPLQQADTRWTLLPQFSQAEGNSKKRTGTDKITANSRSSSGKGQMLFERCSSCCCYCVKSEFFCPRWLNEKLFA